MEDARGRRLFSDLNHAFKKDPLIDEYDFLPVKEPQNNASPLLLVEHKLGLELWSVRLLFQYAYTRLLTWRDRNCHSPFLDPQELCHLSRAVLLINPDCYTAWNIRKELTESGDLPLTDDLRLGCLILTKFPKSAETFSHRRWIFQKLLEHCLSSSNDSSASTEASTDNGGLLCMEGIDIALGPDASVLQNCADGSLGRRRHTVLSLESSRLLAENLQQELSICERAADKYASNYHAWTHREWIVQYCFNSSLQVMLAELDRTRTWTLKHVSDHSGFHYRQFLLSNISRQAARLHRQYAMSVSSLLEAEYSFVCDLINSFPGHEALWYHRRFTFYAIMTSRPQPCEETRVKGDALNGAVRKSDSQKRSRLESNTVSLHIQDEVEAVEKVVNQGSEIFQKTLAKRYAEWVKQTFPE
ncbi:hypothetical protein C0Q70_20407 [Pomacea canaliculata]|uniref:Protein prenyltransferase alpha subunit repeat-containing protein 1 n=1 Tax=Pomacea canaliculata TaxID=400727 RepID=A0A2T7NFF5_POMCA|nr:protein prenyltransferase alpha subunit repeat-containing protein 1-like [Pomacea canaliculata]PVD19913.1 hypothetical protein C0Q70_20407 [Pomacea canaliculata]